MSSDILVACDFGEGDVKKHLFTPHREAPEDQIQGSIQAHPGDPMGLLGLLTRTWVT